MTRLIAAALLAIALAAPGHTAERGYTITSFDRIRVEGPYAVTVRVGHGPSARASGSTAALDAVIVRVDGRTLVVRRDPGAWGGFPERDAGSVSIAVTAPQLVAASLAGSGSLAIDAMRAQRVDLVVEGSGRLRLDRLETDRLGATVVGSGVLLVAGETADARVIVRGSGALEGEQLTAADASVTADGSAAVRMAVRRAVTVQATGSGDVAIAGRPACTVRNVGAGNVTCGDGRR